MKYKTEQEAFWAGSFGNDYVERCSGANIIAQRTGIWAKKIGRTAGVTSAIEFGANIGLNLHALRNLLPAIRLAAIEINEKAIQQLQRLEDIAIFQGSITDYGVEKLGTYDLSFTSGVLIHINPELLPEVYKLLYACSKKYVMIEEYYNPTPVEVVYRNHKNKLFKRDFAGEMMDMFRDLELVDYGFQYHRDANYPLDDATWFLMRKR